MAEINAKFKIAILGPGGVGRLLAALLARSGNEVCCIGSELSIESIPQQIINIESVVFGNFNEGSIKSADQLIPLDLVFITLKAPFLSEAIKNISQYIDKKTLFISLMNGLGHRELIRDCFGSRLIVGSIGALEVWLDTNKIVRHSSPMIPQIEIASNDLLTIDLPAVSNLLTKAGLSVKICSNENIVIWRKMVRLAAISCLTAYARSPIGIVRADKNLRKLLESCVKELCNLADSQGFYATSIEVMRQIDNLPEALNTSMQRDILLRKPSEIESIIGNPLRLGKSLAIPMPTIEFCYTKILEQSNMEYINV